MSKADHAASTTHLRAALIASLLSIGMGVAGQSPELVMSGVPFIVYVAWALLSRPREGEVLDVHPQGRVISSDPALVRFSYDVGPRRLVTVVLSGQEKARFEPSQGALSGMGRVELVAHPFRWGRTTFGAGVACVFDVSLGWMQLHRFPAIEVQVSPGVTSLRGPTGIVDPLGISGPHMSKQIGEGTDLADIRPYRPGDRRRNINWRVSARTKELHVNTSYVEKDADVALLVDTTVNALGAVEERSSLDTAAGAVASLAQYYLGLGDRICMFDVGHQIPALPYGSGQRQLRRVLHAFSTMDQFGNTPERIHHYPDMRTGQLVFVCTPLLEIAVLHEIYRLHEAGLQVVVIDTLPSNLVGNGTDWVEEAWLLRRLQREPWMDSLEAIGIPHVEWTGSGSLAGVLLALERARRAPRLARRTS